MNQNIIKPKQITPAVFLRPFINIKDDGTADFWYNIRFTKRDDLSQSDINTLKTIARLEALLMIDHYYKSQYNKPIALTHNIKSSLTMLSTITKKPIDPEREYEISLKEYNLFPTHSSKLIFQSVLGYNNYKFKLKDLTDQKPMPMDPRIIDKLKTQYAIRPTPELIQTYKKALEPTETN